MVRFAGGGRSVHGNDSGGVARVVGGDDLPWFGTGRRVNAGRSDAGDLQADGGGHGYRSVVMQGPHVEAAAIGIDQLVRHLDVDLGRRNHQDTDANAVDINLDAAELEGQRREIGIRRQAIGGLGDGAVGKVAAWIDMSVPGDRMDALPPLASVEPLVDAVSVDVPEMVAVVTVTPLVRVAVVVMVDPVVDAIEMLFPAMPGPRDTASPGRSRDSGPRTRSGRPRRGCCSLCCWTRRRPG